MYCPSCGSEDLQVSQYCRTCGTDLRSVRVSIERPDSVTASAVSAREEIGRAIAAKIRESDSPRGLKWLGPNVLPQVEKFLESPEEKRLRRTRVGVITGLVGLAVALPMLLIASVAHKYAAIVFALLGFTLSIATFATGLGLVLNGLLFTRPAKELGGQFSRCSPSEFAGRRRGAQAAPTGFRKGGGVALP